MSMLKKVNLKDEVNSVDGLYLYKKIGFLNSHALSVVLLLSSFVHS